MMRCNKSAIILRRDDAVILHAVLKKMDKPSFFGKDKILERFWGYTYAGYFPSHIILRARHLFGTGVIEWWQKYAEYSVVLKTNVNANTLIPKTFNKTDTSEIGRGKTVLVILSLIPGVGLLISLLVFICVETPIKKVLHFQQLCKFS